MKRFIVAAFIVLVVLSLCGSVQAGSVTSRSSGIGSHDAGGSGYATMSTAAGNSAHVERTVYRELDHEASPPDVTVTWSDTATDDVGSVSAAGTLKVSREISGGDDGLVEVMAHLWADLEETGMPLASGDAVWVDTGMESSVHVEAGDGVTSEGSASVTGSATGSGNWLFDGVTGNVASTSRGKVSASGTAKDGSIGDSFAFLGGLAETSCDGHQATLPLTNGFSGVWGGMLTEAEGEGAGVEMAADASGSVTMNAAGSSEDYSYISSGTVSGSSKGEFEVQDGYGAFMSGLGIETPDIIPDIGIGSTMNGYEALLGSGGYLDTGGSGLGVLQDGEDAKGSMKSSAKGTVILRESYSDTDQGLGYTAFASTEGSSATSARQTGEGETMLVSYMDAFPWGQDWYTWLAAGYPLDVDPVDGIGDRYTEIEFDEIVDSWSGIQSETWSTGKEGFGGSTSSSLSGTSQTTMDYHHAADGMDLAGTVVTRADGKVGSKTSIADGGELLSASSISAMASLGPSETNTVTVVVENPDESRPIELAWTGYSAADGMLWTEDWSLGPSTSVSSSVSGSATAGSTGQLSEEVSAGEEFISQSMMDRDFGSTATVRGKVEGEAKSAGEISEAETASLIHGFNAAGDGLSGVPVEEPGPFVTGEHGLLSSSAVWSPDGDESSAEGTASGSANAAGYLSVELLEEIDGELQIQQYDGEKYDLSSTTSGSGTATSEFSAEGGLGLAESWIHGGNIVFSPAEGWGVVASFDVEDWDAGIETATGGMGLTDDSKVEGSASVTKGVSKESGHFEYYLWDDDDMMWDSQYALDTKTVMTDPCTAEIEIEGADTATANAYAYGFSTAQNMGLGPETQAVAGFGAEVTRSDEGDTAKASIRKLNIYTEAKADGTFAWARVNKGFATATLSSSGNSIGPLGPDGFPVIADSGPIGIVGKNLYQKDDPYEQVARTMSMAMAP